MAQQALRDDTRNVVEGLVTRASEKFDRQEATQVALHAETQQAVAEIRKAQRYIGGSSPGCRRDSKCGRAGLRGRAG